MEPSLRPSITVAQSTSRPVPKTTTGGVNPGLLINYFRRKFSQNDGKIAPQTPPNGDFHLRRWWVNSLPEYVLGTGAGREANRTRHSAIVSGNVGAWVLFRPGGSAGAVQDANVWSWVLWEDSGDSSKKNREIIPESSESSSSPL